MGTLISLRILYNTVADPGEGLTLPPPPPPSPPPPSLFADQTEARRAKKNFGDRPRPPLSKGQDENPTPLSQGLDPAL